MSTKTSSSITLCTVALAACLLFTSSASAAVSCPTLTRTLKYGSRGADVTTLQTYLATDPSLYPEAAITGFFGKATEKAVQRFQAAQQIVTSGTPASTGFGSVGARTRAALASCPPPSVVTSPIATTTPIVTPLTIASTTVASSTPAQLITSPLVTFTDGATTTVTLGAGPVPTLTSFYFGPKAVELENGTTTMFWTSSNAINCSVEKWSGSAYTLLHENVGNNGNVNLGVSNNPTLFGLRCTGIGDNSSSSASSIRREVRATVTNPKPTCTVTTDKDSYRYIYDPIQITWTTTGADAVSWVHTYDNEPVSLPFGNQYPNGSLSVSSLAGNSQNLKLNVSGPGGSTTCSKAFTITSGS